MNAEQFKVALVSHVKKRRPRGYSAEWSGHMYKVLEDIGKEFGYAVKHKYKEGEVNHIDFSYFEKSPSAAMPPPIAVIEHENAWNDKETKKDFWKACLYAVPLRVTFGYQSSEEKANATGASVTQYFDDNGFRQPEYSETLLIMGWDQEISERKWLCWHLPRKGKKWVYTKLG